jgi:hypothetical protein
MMKKIPFYNVDPIPPAFTRTGVPEKGDEGRWRFPTHERIKSRPTVSVMMDLPTNRIRLLGRMSRTEERGTLLGVGPRQALFVPDSGSDWAKHWGTDTPLFIDTVDYMLDLEPVVVRPSDSWIENWLDPKRSNWKVSSRRREMLSMLLGYSFEVRDTSVGGRHSDLTSFLRFTNPYHGDLTYCYHIDSPHLTSDLFVVSGPDPTTRFSMYDARDRARDHFAALAEAEESASAV